MEKVNGPEIIKLSDRSVKMVFSGMNGPGISI